MLTSMLLFSLLLCCDTVLGFQFRAINDKASLDQAAALFLDAGISRSNVMAWVECVERYNGPQRQYARTVMNTNWVSVSDDHRHPSLRSILSFKQEMRSGFNCRTGMFVLIKDSLSARRYEPGGRDSGSEATLRGELDYIAETGDITESCVFGNKGRILRCE